MCIARQHAASSDHALPVSVKKTLLLRKPLRCSPAAETALQPLIRCSESQKSNVHSAPEDGFFRHQYDPLVPQLRIG